MAHGAGPQRLSQALSELIALRGYARVQGNAQLQAAWLDVAGGMIARETRALAIKRGVLHVAVANAPLLGELAGFFRESLVQKLRDGHAHLRIRELKFRLDSDIGVRTRLAGSRTDRQSQDESTSP